MNLLALFLPLFSLACSDGGDPDEGEVIEDTGCIEETVTIYVDSDGDGFGDLEQSIEGCGVLQGYADNGDDCDDSSAETFPGAEETCDDVDNNCDALVDEACPIEVCGDIAEDTVWDVDYRPYVATCDIVVHGVVGPVLSIGEGVEVRFETDVGLYTGPSAPGSLAIQGGVSFTHHSDDPWPGAWTGASFGPADGGSEVTGLTLEYGGGNGLGGVAVEGSTPTFSGVVVRNNDKHGVFVHRGGTPEIRDSELRDNSLDGLYVGEGASLASGGSATFTGNTLTGNGRNAATVPPEVVANLDSTSTFIGNTQDQVEVLAGDLGSDATWQALDVPYHLEGDLSLQAAQPMILTIADGAVLTFGEDGELLVGKNGMATLVVDGHTKGVLFTSDKDEPAPNDWQGVLLGQYSQDTMLTGLTVEYAGGNDFGGLYSYFASIVIRDSTFQHNAGNGLYLTNTASVDATGSTFSSNDRYGLFLDNTNELDGLFENNTLTGNGERPIYISGTQVHLLDPSSSFTGNGDDRVAVYQATLTRDVTWSTLDVPYLMLGDLFIQSAAAPVLTIQAGTTVEFESGASIWAGSADDGGLVAKGTESAPILFTSAQDSPAPGDWDGLVFYANCVEASSILENVTVEYAGTNGYGAIWTHTCEATVTDSTVRYSSTWGIFRHYSTLNLEGISYLDNASGDLR